MKTKNRIFEFIAPFFIAHKKTLLCSITLSVSITVISVFVPAVEKELFDKGLLQLDFNMVFFLALSLFLLSILREGFQDIQDILHINLENLLYEDLTHKAFFHMIKIKMNFFTDTNFFENICTVESDIRNIVDIFSKNILNIITDSLKIIGGIIGLSIIDSRLLIIVIIVVLLKFIFISNLAKRKKRAFEKIIDINRRYSRWYSDVINGIKVVKLWNLYDKKEPEYKKFIDRKIELDKENSWIEILENMINSVFEAMIELVIYLVGAKLIIRTQMTIGGLFAFLMYSSLIIHPFFLLMSLKYRIAEILPSVTDFVKFMDLEEDVSGTLLIDSMKDEDRGRSFEFIDVTYQIGGRTILDNINLSIKKQEKIALVGLNGSGKTTFLELLLNLISPSSGTIKSYGIDIKEAELYKYQSKFSVVSQEVYLFNTTIFENLLTEIEEEEIKNVIKRKSCETLIDPLLKLPDGLATMVGAGGAKLSGGERQKVALIRGLLKGAENLILDEATSNYDLESEHKFNYFIKKNKSYANIFLVSHKTEILHLVDRILVFQDGKIIADGTYKDLVKDITLNKFF